MRTYEKEWESMWKYDNVWERMWKNEKVFQTATATAEIWDVNIPFERMSDGFELQSWPIKSFFISLFDAYNSMDWKYELFKRSTMPGK